MQETVPASRPNMKIVGVQQFCRFCGEKKEASELINMSENPDVLGDVYVKLYFINASYVCLDDESLPKTICGFCYQTLDRTHSFLTTVKKVQDTLRALRPNIKAEKGDPVDIIRRPGTPVSPVLIIDEAPDRAMQKNPEMVTKLIPHIIDLTDTMVKKRRVKKRKRLTYIKKQKWIDYSSSFNHAQSHHESLRLCCEHCNQGFDNSKCLDKHRKDCTILVRCKLCLKSFQNLQELKEHEGNGKDCTKDTENIDVPKSHSLVKQASISIEPTAHKSNSLVKKPVVTIDATAVDTSINITTAISIDRTPVETSGNLTKQPLICIDGTATLSTIVNQVESKPTHVTVGPTLYNKIKSEPREDEASEMSVSQVNCTGIPENQALDIKQENGFISELSHSQFATEPMPGNQSDPGTTLCESRCTISALMNEQEIKKELLESPKSEETTDAPLESATRSWAPPVKVTAEPLENQATMEQTGENQSVDILTEQLQTELRNPKDSLEIKVTESPLKSVCSKPRHASSSEMQHEPFINPAMTAERHEREMVKQPCEPSQNQPTEVKLPNNQAHKDETQTNWPESNEVNMAETPDTAGDVTASGIAYVTALNTKSQGFVCDNFFKLTPETLNRLYQSPKGKLVIGVKFTRRDLTPDLSSLLAHAASFPEDPTTELEASLLKNKQIPQVLNVGNMIECMRIFDAQYAPPGCQVGELTLDKVIGMSSNEIKAFYVAKKWSLLKSKQLRNKNSLLKTSSDDKSSLSEPPLAPETNQETEQVTAVALDEIKALHGKKHLRVYHKNDGKILFKLGEIGKRKQNNFPDVLMKKIRLVERGKLSCEEEVGKLSQGKNNKRFPPNVIKLQPNTTASTIMPNIPNTRAMPIIDVKESPQTFLLTDSTYLNKVLQMQYSQLRKHSPPNCTSQLPSTSLQRNGPCLLQNAAPSFNSSLIVKLRRPATKPEQSSHTTQAVSPALQVPFTGIPPTGGNIQVDLASQIIHIPMSSLTPENKATLTASFPNELNNQTNDSTYLNVPLSKVPVDLRPKFKALLGLGLQEVATDKFKREEALHVHELQAISERECRPKVPVRRRAAVDKTWTGYRWECCLCDELAFGSASELREHSKATHDQCFTVRCVDCGEVGQSFASFVAHVAAHRRFLQQYCPYCNCKVEKSSREEHINTHKLWCCCNCGEKSNSANSLALHILRYALDLAQTDGTETNKIKANTPDLTQTDGTETNQIKANTPDLTQTDGTEKNQIKANTPDLTQTDGTETNQIKAKTPDLKQTDCTGTNQIKANTSHLTQTDCTETKQVKAKTPDLTQTDCTGTKQIKAKTPDLTQTDGTGTNQIKANAPNLNQSYQYQCGKCSLPFNYFCALNEHVASHKEVEYICECCKTPFSDKLSLERHIKPTRPRKKRKHVLENDIDGWIGCEFCKKVFRSGRNTYEKHLRIRHKNQTHKDPRSLK